VKRFGHVAVEQLGELGPIHHGGRLVRQLSEDRPRVVGLPEERAVDAFAGPAVDDRACPEQQHPERCPHGDA
jgi:hypothetical protein